MSHPAPKSWLNLWAQENQLLPPSTPLTPPRIDPRLVSDDPLLQRAAQQEQRTSRRAMADSVMRASEPGRGAGGAAAMDLAFRMVNSPYDILRTAPEAAAEWQQPGVMPKARAVRNMALAAMPLVPGGLGGGSAKKLWDLMSAPGSTGFTVTTRGLKPLRRGGYGVADPDFTLVLRTGEGAPPPQQQIEEWLARPSTQARMKEKGVHFGGWWDKDTGRGEVNLTDFRTDLDEATTMGHQRQQKALGSYNPDGSYAGDVVLPAPKGNDLVMSLAARYRQDRGLTDRLSDIDEVDPVAGERMAQQYDRLKSEPHDPNVQAAYEQFAREVDDQYKLIEDAGIKIEFVDADPYKTSAEMMADVRTNNRLRVLKTNPDSRHPLLSNEQNDRFRAVHDFFGHSQMGRQFGVKGEELAYREHMRMFSPIARRVMATETRGQNSWFNFGPGRDLPPGERPFATQKAALWPEEMLGEYEQVRAYRPPPDLPPGGLVPDPRPITPRPPIDEAARAARYDALAKPATDPGDFVERPAPVTERVHRIENAEGLGPFSSGSREVQGAAISTRGVQPTFGSGRRGEFPEEWLFGFRNRHQLNDFFPPENREALAEFGYHPAEYDVIRRGNRRGIKEGNAQLVFDSERAMPTVLGGTSHELEAMEAARALEGQAELDRIGSYLPLMDPAETAGRRLTDIAERRFERGRMSPAIRTNDTPTRAGTEYEGSSHFQAVMNAQEAHPSDEEIIARAVSGFTSPRRGFMNREEAMRALTKAQRKIAEPIVVEQGFPRTHLTSEALGEVQVPPEPVAPLPREEVVRTRDLIERILSEPGETDWLRPRGIFDRSARDPVIAGTSLPPARGKANPIVQEIASDPETYRLARMAVERGLPMGGLDFYQLGPIRAEFGAAGGPISFEDFNWATSASSAMQPVRGELTNASILLYAMRNGISVEEATAEMLRRYPGVKRPYMLPVHRSGFERYRQTGRIDPRSPTSGARKIPSYGRGKLGEEGVNVLDTHELNFLGMPSRWRRYMEAHTPSITGADYEALDLNRRIARDLGIEPRQAQAGRWIGGAPVTGVRTPAGDYVQILEDAILRQSELLGRGTDPASLRRQFRSIFTQGEDFLLPEYGTWKAPAVR